MNTENVVIVLVEPQGPRNIGSVCRAMLNFGMVELRLVNPQTDHLLHEARQMAVKATTVLEEAVIFTRLEDALADCALSIGTTRRFGRYREDMLHPDEAAKLLLPVTAEAKVALVFGREDKGLHTAELDLCQRFVTIPTSDRLPSMNLAQSVALCLYEISKTKGEMAGAEHGRKSLASNDDLERMFQHMRESLTRVAYLDPQNPDHILRAFRRILGRAELNDRDVRILRGLFSRIDYLDEQMQRLKESGKNG
ncbi:tRNA/rRNA methyltransferase [Malonomonas rubra DSM 5091]|uniref:tRNA (cytidine/uridine-2'-O-)-methyltransferase TrmJ n=1 Tax=Malonomonas rubra DSM 5091 TaxID=1122189 RepID=A0A1M6KHQ7_MALRU|nr:RNA methyltransferase [Malonomonas rubra]SHJ58442.1 tRNA/rRNA methyltransferase [Malonomonas rubra DSM 5091]